MSKFTIAARIVELSQAPAVTTSRAHWSAEVEETLLQHFLKVWRSRSAAQLKSAPAAHIDPAMIEEKWGEPVPHKASHYDLASSNPHVIAATLFSRKRW